MNYKIRFLRNCLNSLRRKHLELFLFHIKEALIHVDMQYWTKKEWAEEKTIWELYIQIVKADQFFWGRGCRIFPLIWQRKQSVCRVCVNMGQSVFWSVNVSAFSSCHRFMLLIRTLFSNSNCRWSTRSRKFFLSTYLQTQRAETVITLIMVEESTSKQALRKKDTGKNPGLLFLVSVRVQWLHKLNIIFLQMYTISPVMLF